MLNIDQGFELWAGDVTWLLARNIILMNHGEPKNEKEANVQDGLARKLLESNSGLLIRQ